MPDPDTIKNEYALTPEMKALKADRDQQIADIITGKDDRVLAIIGPCSADNEDSVCEYVNRLTSIQEMCIRDSLLAANANHTVSSGKRNNPDNWYTNSLHASATVTTDVPLYYCLDNNSPASGYPFLFPDHVCTLYPRSDGHTPDVPCKKSDYCP